MKFPATIKRVAAGTMLALAMSIGVVTVTASPVLAATTVQEEAMIGAANVTNGDTTFTKNGITAKVGDTVAFEVYYHNLEAPSSGKDALNVRIKVSLPSDFATLHNVGVDVSGDNFSKVSASTTVNSAPTATQMQFDANSGITWRHNTGTNSAPNWVTEKVSNDVVTGANGAIVDKDEFASNNFAGTLVFKAKLVGQPPVVNTPVYTCDAFNITADADRNVKVNVFNTTATNGAVFKNAVINWGDNTANTTDTNIIGKTHKYAKDGTYTIATTAHFTVNGQDVTAGGVNCSKQVTFDTTKPPVVVPPTTPPTTPTPTPAAPTTLVNTGAGSVLGMFAAATIAGVAIYRRMLTRRIGNQ